MNKIYPILLCIFFNSILSAEMVKVPSGSYKPFLKESIDIASKPVWVKSFYLDKYPVTRKEYLEFIQNHKKWQKKDASSLFVDDGYLGDWKSSDIAGIGNVNSPVTQISWFAAKSFCEWKGKRLPFESEWEYAASFPATGKSSKDVDKKIMDWYGEKKPEELPSIGGYSNRLGIFDLHGLIWEWVYDFNTSSVTGDSRQDTDIENTLFCGGGSLKADDFRNYAAYMRFGYRAGLKGWYTAKYLGFRCASDKVIKN